eukprot:gene12406-biopygen413
MLARPGNDAPLLRVCPVPHVLPGDLGSSRISWARRRGTWFASSSGPPGVAVGRGGVWPWAGVGAVGPSGGVGGG